MSDQPTVTEREAIKRERKAFENGAVWCYLDSVAPKTDPEHDRRWEAAAKELFRLPAVQRSRVVRRETIYGEMQMRIATAGPEFWYPKHAWSGPARWSSLSHQIEHGNGSLARCLDEIAAMLVELRANPTETVEDDT